MTGRPVTAEETLRAFEAPEPRGFITTDWKRDVIDSLTLLHDALTRLDTDPSYAVKWALVAAHSASTSALAAHLSGSYGVGALEERAIDQVRTALEEGLMLPSKERIASFLELLERATVEGKKREPTGGVHKEALLQIPGEDRGLLERLNTLRNRYVHFRFGGWSLETAYALESVEAGLRLIEAINVYGWGLLGENSERIAAQIGDCTAILQKQHGDVSTPHP